MQRTLFHRGMDRRGRDRRPNGNGPTSVEQILHGGDVKVAILHRDLQGGEDVLVWVLPFQAWVRSDDSNV